MKINAFSSGGDTCVLEIDPAVEEQRVKANELVHSQDGKIATFHDEGTGLQIHDITSEQGDVLRVPWIVGG